MHVFSQHNMLAVSSDEGSYRISSAVQRHLCHFCCRMEMPALALIHLRIRFCRRGYLAALAKAEAPAEEALAAAEADAADVAGDADVAAGDSVSPEADSVPATSLEAPSTRWVPFADGHGTMVPFLFRGLLPVHQALQTVHQ